MASSQCNSEVDALCSGGTVGMGQPPAAPADARGGCHMPPAAPRQPAIPAAPEARQQGAHAPAGT